MPSPSYLRPARLDDALRLIARGGLTVLAGGTDHYPARVGRPLVEDILDLSAITELRGIVERPDHWRIGATTTWTDLIESELPPLFDGLRLAAREVGGVQIQNRGTVAGNLCNASPAADGVPPLLALDAEVEISRDGHARRMPLQDFIVGPRRTVLAQGELVTAVVIPRPADPARSSFVKLGARRYLVISIAMVAATVVHAKGVIRSARVAVGACSPVARRLPALESALAGKRLRPGLGAAAMPAHLAPLTPIDDVRASSGYREEGALALVRRALDRLATDT